MPQVNNMPNAIMKYFDYEHLPEGQLRQTSAIFSIIAWDMENILENSPEKSAGLRKLLEAKDCFVRAAL
jgi:hypothetical protein